MRKSHLKHVNINDNNREGWRVTVLEEEEEEEDVKLLFLNEVFVSFFVLCVTSRACLLIHGSF